MNIAKLESLHEFPLTEIGYYFFFATEHFKVVVLNCSIFVVVFIYIVKRFAVRFSSKFLFAF